MNILVTGGSGLLGRHLIPILEKEGCEVAAPSSREFDITNPSKIGSFDIVFHGAALTDVEGLEKDRESCFEVNSEGTRRMLQTFSSTPFVYISSEYAGNPVNVYSESKRLAEQYVTKSEGPHLIIRTLFKPNPFPYPRAFVDQFTMGDYVDVISQMIAKKVLNWDTLTSELTYIGTGRKSIFDLAKRSRKNIQPLSVDDIQGVKLPKDYV